MLHSYPEPLPGEDKFRFKKNKLPVCIEVMDLRNNKEIHAVYSWKIYCPLGWGNVYGGWGDEASLGKLSKAAWEYGVFPIQVGINQCMLSEQDVMDIFTKMGP